MTLTKVMGDAFAQRMATPPTRVAAQHPERAVFSHEGPDVYAQAALRNRQFAKPGPELTHLGALQEAAFRAWVAAQHVPFDPNEATPDYDMRGYYTANPGAQHGPGDHFPDTFKTIRDATFSAESRYAKPGTPYVWRGNTLVDQRTGQVISR